MDKPIACRCGAELVVVRSTSGPAFDVFQHPESGCFLSSMRFLPSQIPQWNTLMDPTPAMTLAANAMKQKAAYEAVEASVEKDIYGNYIF